MDMKLLVQKKTETLSYSILFVFTFNKNYIQRVIFSRKDPIVSGAIKLNNETMKLTFDIDFGKPVFLQFRQ